MFKKNELQRIYDIIKTNYGHLRIKKRKILVYEYLLDLDSLA